MRTFFILAAGALLLAAAITEIPSRLWPESHLAVLLVAFIALFVQGWLGSRLLFSPAAQPAPAERQTTGGKGQGRQARSGGGNRQRDNKSEGRKADATVRTAAADDTARESGTVKWFNRSKGFGFIVRASGDEIFVHQRSIRSDQSQGEGRRPSLRDGQAVSFLVVEREKGLQAEDVTPET